MVGRLHLLTLYQSELLQFAVISLHRAPPLRGRVRRGCIGKAIVGGGGVIAEIADKKQRQSIDSQKKTDAGLPGSLHRARPFTRSTQVDRPCASDCFTSRFSGLFGKAGDARKVGRSSRAAPQTATRVRRHGVERMRRG